MDKIDTDELRRMNAARIGPQVTCPASRHTGMIAEALIAGNEDQQHQGGSIASTVASLWEARAEVLASRAREAELQARLTEARAAWEAFEGATITEDHHAAVDRMRAALGIGEIAHD